MGGQDDVSVKSREVAAMATIGFIGSGNVGRAVARRLDWRGHSHARGVASHGPVEASGFPV